MTKVISLVVALLVIAGGLYLVVTKKKGGEQAGQEAQKEDARIKEQDFSFGNPKKSAHHESNAPAHGAILAAPPINIVIDFNFDLAAPSSISVAKDGTEYARGETSIDNNKLTMRRGFAGAAPDGLYKVSYRACWPDKSCHDGNFEFAIDRARAASFENLRGKKEVAIHMSEIMFAPKNIVIDAGTKITWVNDDSEEHFVNTDSHPAHTYYMAQNSRALAKGGTYSATFEKPGSYPYHCSAHAETMIGEIVVAAAADPVTKVDQQKQQTQPQGSAAGQARQSQNSPPPQELQPERTSPEPNEPLPEPAAPQPLYVTTEASDGGATQERIEVAKGTEVQLTFKVKTENVYYGGLDFRSPVVNTGTILPGASKTVIFTANSSFDFTPYWPASNIQKGFVVKIIVQ